MVLATLDDVKYAIRSFARRPLFTAGILVTLALGIGSTVAIFSVANTVLFRALPFQDPEELAFVWTRLPSTNVQRSLVSGPDFRDYQNETTRFDGLAGAVAIPGTLTGDGPAEQITNAYVTWNLLSLLGVRPLLGRSHIAEDAFPIDPQQFGSPNPDLPPGKVVLSHGLWLRRFGGDPSVIGRTIQMDGWGSVVVGVLPPDFRIYLPADAAMPTNIDAWGVLPSNIGDFARDAAWLTVVARLKAAGAIVLGKTNTPEYGWTADTDNRIFGPTRNPWDVTRVPGGSSGGTGAAIAASFAVLGTGSDTGQSVRSPASALALVGLRPTRGLVSRIADLIYATTVMVAAPTAEVAATWIADGTADRIVQWKRAEVRARSALASDAWDWPNVPSICRICKPVPPWGNPR